MSEAVVPRSFSEAAAALAAAAAKAQPVRVVGGGTKLGWGGNTPPHALRFHMAHLSRVAVHEDRASATINAGTPLARAQSAFARDGLMLAADPQLGLSRGPAATNGPAATVGGVVATADTGPLSHRYGELRDQVLGITVALSDGSIVRTGPRAQQVQGGLDVSRLFTGSFGSLGLILAVDVRLWPLPARSASALATAEDPEQLAVAAALIADEHPDLQAFDFAWRDGRGGLLAQLVGDDAEHRARALAARMTSVGLRNAAARADDANVWARQRAGQRSADRAILRVRHRPEQLGVVLRAADLARATTVGRAARGVAYLTVDVAEIATVRGALPDGAAAVALDLPAAARGAIDAWSPPAGPSVEMMRDLKREFDPAGVCNTGIFVGSI